MRRLIWTPGSLADLARLHAFLKPNNPDAARRPIAFGVAGYVVLYRLDERQAVILAIRHGRELGY